jgi:SnoaL-like domain
MKAIEVGKKLVELCNKGKQDECVETLYSPDIVSVEAASMPNMPAEMKGIQAVKGKAKWWNDNHTVHSSKAEGPFPMGDRFIVKFHFDITNKQSNKRTQVGEAALYTVKNDKIVREEFFYVTE